MRTPPTFEELVADKTLLFEKVKDIRATHLSSNDYADFRVYRLYRVLGYCYARFNCSSEELPTRYGLVALHDHKGNLTSVWSSPSHFVSGIKHVQAAWFNEDESQHEAIVLDPYGDEFQTVRVS